MPETPKTSSGAATWEQNRWQRAQKLVESLSVKQHLFLPSRRSIWTVVGTEGDSLIDYSPSSLADSAYCSCDDFHFRVLSGKVPECYHLIAAREAMEKEQYEVVEFHDSEFLGFLRALVEDLFAHFK